MVTSFYIMKMNKKKLNMEEYYTGLLNTPSLAFKKKITIQTECTICLQNSDISIISIPNAHDIKEALSIFDAAELEDDIRNPAYLCNICYTFLKTAALFRKVLQQTNERLKQPTIKQSPEYINDYDYTITFKSDKPNQNYSIKEYEEVDVGTKVQCPICKKTFNRNHYKTHLKVHNPDVPESYVCDICGKSFQKKNVYNSHRQRHESRFIYKCQYCPYAGKYKERLSMHMRVHKGDLKYLCTECPARYISRGSLSDHMKLKHTEPQYKCDSCDKAYHNSLNLQRHIDAAHLKIRQHECNVCNAAFGYRRGLMKHQRTVHKRACIKPRFSASTYKPISKDKE